MSAFIRYDMNYAMLDRSFNPQHPQKQLAADGMKEIRSEPIPIGDCWVFEVETLVTPLPKWYTVMDSFKFSS